MNVHTTPQAQTVEAPACAPVRAAIVETYGTVRVEDLQPSESGSLLTALQEVVGGLIDVVALDEHIDMYVHDEGFYVCDPNPVATMIAMATALRLQPFFGPAVFTGGVDAKGMDTSIDPDAIEAIKEFSAALTQHPDEMADMAARSLRAVGH